MRTIYIFILLLVVLSCCNEQHISKELRLLQLHPIILPQDDLIVFNSDSIINSEENKLKYIIYSDSLACTSCMINNLVSWNSLIEYGKNFNKEIGFYFIFSPERKYLRSINMLIQHSEFKHQIIVDEKKYFEKLNPYLPKDHLLHTFLLDENNRVILVGNPLRNEKIKEMFYKIVEEKLGKPGEVAVKED